MLPENPTTTPQLSSQNKLLKWLVGILLLIIIIIGIVFVFKNKIEPEATTVVQKTDVLPVMISPKFLVESKLLSEFDASTDTAPVDYEKDNADLRKAMETYRDKAKLQYDNRKYRDAILNFTKAIDIIKNNELPVFDNNLYYHMYWGRAESYLNIEQYENAIADYSKAININLVRYLALMNIATIRALYPEFEDISDQDLIDGLRQKYDPITSSDVFTELLTTNPSQGREQAVEGKNVVKDLTYLYLGRGDMYKKIGDLRNAAKDYRRAIKNSPIIEKALGPDRDKIIKEN